MAAKNASKEKSHSLGEFAWNVFAVIGSLAVLAAGIELIDG